MKFAITLLCMMALGLAFADGKGKCDGCGDKTFKVSAFNHHDAEFLAMANKMAGNKACGECTKMKSCCAPKAAKKLKKAAKAR